MTETANSPAKEMARDLLQGRGLDPILIGRQL